MGTLDGKVAIITGGGSGIGFAIAERFAREGAQVVLAGRRPQRLEEAAAKIGRGARSVPTDVGDEAQVKRLMDSVPQVDLLVTCAGGAVFGPVEEVSTEAWSDMFKSRLFGQLSAVRYAVPKMAPGSSIVLCSGVAGRSALTHYAGGAALCGGINAMGASLAIELAPKGIRVNVLSPGLTRDTSIDWGIPPEKLGAFMDGLVDRIPLRRSGTVHDMADAVFFLSTNAYATGQVLDIDGGWTAV